jgi:hypothetical protein
MLSPKIYIYIQKLETCQGVGQNFNEITHGEMVDATVCLCTNVNLRIEWLI